MSFEELVGKQHELGDNVKRLIRNFSKDSKERKSTEYFSNKLETLTNWADEFHKIHQQILKLGDKPEDESYLTNNYYEEITELILKYQKIFENGAMQVIEPDLAATTQDTAGSTMRKLLRNQRALMVALNKNIDEILKNRRSDQPTSYYNIKASIIEKHMVDLATNNATLWTLTDEDSIEDYTLQTYYELEAKAEEAIIELQQHMQLDHSIHNSSTPGVNEADVRLPRITLPKFDGNYQRWMEFKDLFTELVHNATISDAKKMHYLTTTLEGEPKNLIKHLPAVGTNYSTAWAMITSRYDNKRLLVSALLNKLLKQSAIKKEGAPALKSLHDVTRECIHGLKAQAIPVQHWDAILVHILLQKMDEETQKAFEQGLSDNRRLITVDETLKFLERRFQSFEAREKEGESSSRRTCASAAKTGASENCPICKDAHKIYVCKKFAGADLKQKWKYVKDMHLCVNCLKDNHRVKECKSRNCSKCPKMHNTLLHNPNSSENKKKAASPEKVTQAPQQTQAQSESSSAQPSSKVSLVTNNHSKESNYILLATARIKLISANGHHVECRAVLDAGSQINLITDRMQKKLGCKPRTMSMTVEGVGVNETRMRHQITIQFQSKINDFTTKVDAHIIPKIVSNQPMQFLSTEAWGIPQDVVLADPDFYKPGRIDCLLGAEVFFELLRDGQIKLAENLPILRNSVLGWIVAGKVETSTTNKATCGICTSKDLDETISRFWDAEEISEHNTELTEDELRCEAHFLQHTFRDQTGRFVVKLPLKDHPSVLTDSKGLAYERFKNIERRLEKNPSLKEQYVNFMREYEALGHMSKVHSKDISNPYYFIPHHCVLRPESVSTKLRVVFDASARRPSGLSLNDIMFSGPTVQSELFSILLRFRIRRFVLKTDVEKMFRQILVHPDDRNLLLIMWRENANEPIQTYQLNTVTYGTRSAPYLAARCLNFLADSCTGQYPYGAGALRKDFYVDDGLTGADSLHEALEIQQQLISILGSAGMKLKKWCANHPRLLSGIAPEDQEVDLNFESKEDQSTKTLGLQWLPKSDVFCLKVTVQEHNAITKRTMSSDLAHIYDPLGLIGPVLVTGKIQLQRTWQLKSDWDEELPEDVREQWISYRKELTALENAKFPRYVLKNLGSKNIQIHTFADASEKAYGAVVYLRTVQKDNTVTVNLLCSKSRVAPLKTQTIPRLELCAALLAAELTARVKIDLGYQDKASYLWTDSQIVLAWLNNHPGKLPVYVAHRVVKILRLTIPDQWYHVPSKQNPADVLSRGLKPREFAACHVWTFGPMFLYQSKALWPTSSTREENFESTDENAVSVLTTTQTTEESPIIYTIDTKNSFLHLNKVVGYILRFTRNTRIPKESRPEFRQLSPLELDAALKCIVRQIQLSDFADVRKDLAKTGFISKNSHLSSLTPFLDEEGIIRVGGRLKQSNQQHDAIHQMMLPDNDPIVKILVQKIHQDHYHCGPQALLAQVRQRFWPLKGKSLARAVVQRCVKCTRAKPRFYDQLMGSLPAHRVQPARPFLNTGVDYCGPFTVHFKIRGKRPQKAYISVFCCFATKAVHLELVTDLTTDAFIGALKRFIARRGNCKTLYCDNATNFVGARNQLKELEEAIYGDSSRKAIISTCSNKGIEFRFIPPRSPHFGGLWEAAVKSAKNLLLKNVSTSSLTYEELETVVVEIEAILNSRPLIPSSSDANDFNAITPGHFLIGEELTSTVDVHAQEPKRTLLERWNLVSQLKHNFWQRWSREYLNELQYRHKWKEPRKEILPGTMVIIKEDNIPVLQWPLGRILNTIKGDDGFVRVCEVKTQKGIFKRPIHRLAPLFPENNSNNSDPPSTNANENQTEPAQEIQRSAMSLPISIPLNRLQNRDFLESNSSPKKRPRLQSTLLLSILMFMLLPLVLCGSVQHTKFDNKPGLYFEKTGNIRLATSDWNMVVFFDLQPLHNELNLLLDGILSLQKLCDHATSDSSCPFLLNYFDNTRDDLLKKFHLLSSRRTKRGALDIVGNVANSLFGVLDSNYASKMSDTIDILRKNDAHLEMLFKNQTSLINSTINIIKANQLSSQQKFDEIDKRISSLLFDDAENTPLHQLYVNQHILALSVQLLTMVSNLLWMYSSIMDVLIDSHHDKLNPMLLTPYQLHEEIMKIKSHLALDLQLPIHQDNLLEAYRLCKVSGVVAKRHVIFNIQLPLADPREFELLHLVPIAATLNDSLTTVKLSTKYIAISKHRDEFVSLSEHQLDTCLTLDDNEYLCKNTQATYKTGSTTNKCELDLFFNQPHPRCEFYRLEDKTTWHQLHRPNHWIYATVYSNRLNAVCNSESFSLELQGCGLVQLQPECIVKSDLLTIRGHAHLVTKLYTTIKQPLMPLGWSKQLNASNISTTVFNPRIHELELIQKGLAQINESNLSVGTPAWRQHSLIVSYVAIIFTIITICFILLKGKGQRKEQPYVPTPAPRTQDTAC